MQHIIYYNVCTVKNLKWKNENEKHKKTKNMVVTQIGPPRR